MPAKIDECRRAGGDFDACFIPWCQSATASATGGFNASFLTAERAVRVLGRRGPARDGGRGQARRPAVLRRRDERRPRPRGPADAGVDIPPPGGGKGTPVGVNLKLGCSKAEVELSGKVAGTGGLVSLFVRGQDDFKNDSATVVIGAKGSVAGILTGQNGVYVTIAGGGVKDVGFRTGAGVGVAGIKVFGGDTIDFSLIGAVDNIGPARSGSRPSVATLAS